ncbi:MAG: FtsB family cell division protein [Aeromicrobium sp.]
MTPTSKRGPGRSSSKTRAASTNVGRTGNRPSSQGLGSRTRGLAKKTMRGPQFTTRAVVLLAVVLLLIASYTSSLHAWWDQRGEIQSRKAEIVMRKNAIKELNDDKERWSDPAFVEQQARERFGWVLPGEVGYRVIGSDGKVQGSLPTLDAPPTPEDKQWADKLWGTVVESGKPPPKKKTVEPDPDKVLKKDQ